IFGAANLDRDLERVAIETLLEYRPDALILTGSQQSSRFIGEVAQQVPVALVGRLINQPAVDCFAVDDRRAATLATEHLVDLGHRRVVHVDGGYGAGAAERRDAYRRSMRRNGLADEVRIIAGAYTEEAGAEAARGFVATGDLPTAVFAANDLVAIGVLD